MSLYIFWLVMSFYILDIAKICRMLRYEESLRVQKTQIKVAGKISFRQLKLVICFINSDMSQGSDPRQLLWMPLANQGQYPSSNDFSLFHGV